MNTKKIFRDILKEYNYGDQDNDEGFEYSDVERTFKEIKDAMRRKGDFLRRINEPIEKVELIVQFAEKIGVPRSEFYPILGQIKSVAREQEEEEEEIDYSEEEFIDFQKDAESYMENIIDDPNVSRTLSRINKPKERKELIEKFIELVGVPFHKLYDLMDKISEFKGTYS